MSRRRRRTPQTAAARRLSDDAIRQLALNRDGVAFHGISPPERGSSVVQLLYSVQGTLDQRSLNRGWERVLQLHAALSARFFRERGTVTRQSEIDALRPVEWKDWRWLPAPERVVCLQAFLREDRERGFNLSGPPLIRLAVIGLGATTDLVVLSVHPLLLEGGSGRLLLMEGLRSLIERAKPHGASEPGPELAEAG